MSRVSTLGVELQIILDKARAGYAQFKQEIEANPPRIAFQPQTSNPTGVPGPLTSAPSSLGDGRTLTSFGGNAVFTTAPPNPAFPSAPNLPTIWTPTITTATQPAQLQAAAMGLPIPQATVALPAAGVAAGQAAAVVQQQATPAGQGSGYGGYGARRVAMSAIMVYEGANRIATEFAHYNQQEISSQYSTLDEQVQQGLAGANAAYSGGLNYYVNRLASSKWSMLDPTGTFQMLHATGKYQNPDENLRGAEEAKLRLEAQKAQDRSRENQFKLAESISTIGLTGYRRTEEETNNALADQQRDFSRRREAVKSAPGEDANAAIAQINKEESLAKDKRDRTLAEAARQRDYDIRTSDVETTRLTTIGRGGSQLAADRQALVDKQQLDLAEAQKSKSPEEVAALRRRQHAQLGAMDYDQFVTRASEHGDYLYGTAEAIAQGGGQTYEAGKLAIQGQNYQELLNAPAERRLDVIVQGFTRLQAYDAQYQRQSTATAGAMDAQARAQELQLGGFRGSSRRAAVEAQFIGEAGTKYVPVKDKAGNVTGFQSVDASAPNAAAEAAAFNRRFQIAGEAANIQTAREDILRAGGDAALDAMLHRKPLDARLADVESERQDALVGKKDQTEIARINKTYELLKRKTNQQFNDESTTIQTTLTGQQEALTSLLARQPGEAAEAYMIGASGLNEARGLINSGHQDLAALARDNTVSQLALTQQSYFDNFHGVQVSGRLTATQGGRQSEDPGAVINAIEKAKADLLAGFAQAIKDAVTGN